MSAMIPTGSGSMPNAINIGDFNGDSHLDVAAAGFGNGKCGAALGNGNGSFGPAQSITVGESPVAIAVGDVDHDGALDIVLADDDRHLGRRRRVRADDDGYCGHAARRGRPRRRRQCRLRRRLSVIPGPNQPHPLSLTDHPLSV
jgi:hypothetical protein